MDNPYAKYLTPQATPQATPGVIYGRPKAPDPIELERLELSRNSDARAALASDRAAANQDRQASAAERSVATQERVAANTNIDNASGLRKEFTALPEVKDFSAMRSARNRIGQLATKPNPTPQDDMAMIFSYMKLLDPGSVVREGEYATAQNAGSIPDNLLSAYNKAVEGNPLTPDKRQNMAQAAVGVYKTQRQVFNDRAKYYREIAQKQGIDPDLVTGFYVDKPEDQARGAPQGQNHPIGEIQFGAEPGGKLPGADDYAREVEQGVQNGTIKNADDVAAVARKYGFGEPDRAQTEQAFEALRKGARFGGAGLPEYASVQKARQDMAAERGDSVVDPAVRGAADALTLGLADEIAGVGNAIATGGNVSEQIALQRATDQFDEQNNFRPRLAGQLLAGLALPTGGATGVADLAKVGGAYGAAYGFGSANGSLGDRLGGAAIGGVTGAGASAALGALGNGLASRLANRTPRSAVNQDVVDAAERQGVQIVRPDADPTKRSTYGFLETLPFAGGRVRQDLQRGADQIEQRVADIGGGVAAPRQTVGDTVRTGGERYVERSKSVVSRLYDRAAQLSGGAQITPRNAAQTIERNIAELSETPNANKSKLDVLNQLRGDLVDDAGNVKPLSIQAIRDLRTNARDELAAKGLRFTDAERRVMQVIDSASQDIEGQLTGAARRAYQRADRSYRERADIVDNVVEKFIGNSRSADRSPEKVIGAIENASAPRSGDARALDQMMQRLEPNERQEVASLIAGQLGRRGEDGDNAFSPQLFFRQVQKYSPEARAAIFGKKGAVDLADLATIAEGRAGTMERLNNSRSGQASNWFEVVKSALTGGGVGGVAGAATGIGAAPVGAFGMAATPVALGGAFLSAKSLGSPRVVSALAQAARASTTPAKQQVIRYLSTLATREPVLAQDLLPLKEALQSAISRAAASDQEQDRRQ